MFVSTKTPRSFTIFFGAIVCRARADLDYTQAQVAEAADVTVKTVQNIEKGEHMPRHILMLRLMILLEIDPKVFKEEVGVRDPLPRGERHIATR